MSVSNYCGQCGQANGGMCETTRKQVTEKKKKAPSTYNKFFSEKMQLPEIKSLPHKERMAKIGEMWKAEKGSAPASAAPPAAAATATAAAPPPTPAPVVNRV